MTNPCRFRAAAMRVRPYAAPARIPLSFVYGETAYRGLPEELFHPTIRRCPADANLVCKQITGRLPDGLEVRVEYTEYQDFPAVEWYAEFTNTAAQNSPRLRQVRLIDEAFRGENPVLLHSNGDTVTYEGYQMLRTAVDEEGLHLQTDSGSPCNGAFPFMRLMTEGGGYNFAVGWPGGWSGEFRKTADGVAVWFSQETLDTYLLPGETLRTPRVLVMAYDGDEAAGRHQWRRFFRQHLLVRENGVPLDPMHVMSYGGGGVEFTLSTEQNQLEAIDTFLAKGFRPDIWWIDAGWYPCGLKWEAAGTWEPHPEHYPHGLGPIGKKCAENGIRFLLWFELERVTEGSRLDREHPEWMLYTTNAEGETDWTRMLNLADQDCLRWAIDRVDGLIQEGHVKIYRQDFNIARPAAYWRGKDAENRAGTTENHYIQNLLTFWDTLVERNPGLWIDNCSSGGRRNDYELMRRAVPLHYTDVGYGVHPEKQQQYRVMFEWLPYFRALCMNWDKPDGSYGQWAMPDDPPYSDAFATYASLAPALDQKIPPDCSPEEQETAQRMLAIWRPAAELMLRGDYYPLLESHKHADRWYACQFDDPQRGDGFVHAIRNIRAEETSITLFPHVEQGAEYRFTCMDPPREMTLSAEALSTHGLSVSLPQRAGVVWFYQKKVPAGAKEPAAAKDAEK